MASEAPMQYTNASGDSFDYEADPVAAMTSYSKLMHLHTKKQMDAAKRASRRRTPDAAIDAHSPLTKEGSIESTTTTSSNMSF